LTNLLLSAIYNGKTRIEVKDLILREIEHHFGSPEIETLPEPYKRKFNDDIEELINELEQKIKKPSH